MIKHYMAYSFISVPPPFNSPFIPKLPIIASRLYDRNEGGGDKSQLKQYNDLDIE